MTISQIILKNFRSYQDSKFALDPGLNLVVGPNGSGKTNLLEAVYVLAQTKSYRTLDKFLITRGKDWYSLRAEAKGVSHQVTYQLKPKKQKIISINKTPAKLERYIGTLPVVLFEPNSVFIATGAPSSRRQYLDGVLCAVDKRYLTSLIQYRRALKQRNSLLRGDPRAVADQVFAWDIKLAELAAYIYERRSNFLMFLEAKLGGLYQRLSKDKISIDIEYQTTCDTSDYAASLMEMLKNNLGRDILLGSTSDGVHRDDVAFRFGDSSITDVASRGEVRTFILGLKLIELEYLEKFSKSQPIILLDDVFSELDVYRRELLLSRLGGYQALITTTDLHGFKDVPLATHAIITLGSENARRRKTLSGQKSPRARSRASRGASRRPKNT